MAKANIWASVGVVALSALSACSSSSDGGSSTSDSSTSDSAGPSGGCPGIAHRFGGPVPEGAVICHDNASVDICKDGTWQSAGVSCADSTTKDSAGVVHACQCSTNYGAWGARCWYESSTCLTVSAGGGAPCAGQPAGSVCVGNWHHTCDGSGTVTASDYCPLGCAGSACASG